MYGSNYLGKQRRLLLSRRESKMQILKDGGEQALSHSSNDIARIDVALLRIETKQYGLCANCGNSIEEERLAILPEAVNCAPCQKELEEQTTVMPRTVN